MIAAAVNITPEIERIFKEMAADGWPVIEAWVAPLIAAGFGGLPCIVVRNLNRHVVRVDGLKAYLEEKHAENNHLRYISTYPECIEAVKRGTARPNIPGSYVRSAW
jgi:hypothetical protein